MFFKHYFNGLSEVLDVKYHSHMRDGINSADVGELCELFLKDFLLAGLDDHYSVFRGGNIINVRGIKSPQLDIILTNRNALKIFSDKGIYPIETVCGVFCVTSNLTLTKLKHEISQLSKIPKFAYGFDQHAAWGEKFNTEKHEVWKNLVPYSCIFGFTGDITENWLNAINEEVSRIQDHSLWPTTIIVNKKGMIEKVMCKEDGNRFKWKYVFTALNPDSNYGEWCSQILFQLYNLSGEQYYMRPKYENYFSQDYGVSRP